MRHGNERRKSRARAVLSALCAGALFGSVGSSQAGDDATAAPSARSATEAKASATAGGGRDGACSSRAEASATATTTGPDGKAVIDEDREVAIGDCGNAKARASAKATAGAADRGAGGASGAHGI